MSDIGRFLPLSHRPSGPEPEVTSDRRVALAALVDRAAELVAKDERGQTVLARAFADDAALGKEYAAVALDDALDDRPEGASPALTALAAAVRSGRRRNVRALAAGARGLLSLARDLDVEVALDPATAGAVALYLAGSGPFDRRAVVKGHTIRATDADWAFGNGPVLEATSTGIAAFLLGVSDEPPHPPVASTSE